MFPPLCLLLKRNGGMESLGCNTCGLNPMWVKSVGEVGISDPAYIWDLMNFFNKWLRHSFNSDRT